MKSLISVIVPIYNVEKYLDRCIKSIVNQTYQNLEIILVDDGSTDNSGKICDEYVKKDDRIKVIHKENGGLSDARNVGIENATGRLIGFVDSDDYIDKDMFELLNTDLTKYDADIAICNVKKENENAELLEECGLEEIRVFNKKEALKLLIKDLIKSYAWNKLYKIELFAKVRFPVGKTMEDVATTYKIFEKAEKIVFEGNTYYHYINRNESILHKIKPSLILDWNFAINQRYQDLIDKYESLKEDLIINKLGCLVLLFKYFYQLEEKNMEIKDIFEQEYSFYRKYYRIYKDKIGTSRKNKLEAFLLYFNKNIFKMYVHLIKLVKCKKL